MRTVLCGALAAVAFGLLAGGALSKHDDKAWAAGVWTIDPKGKPGELRIAVTKQSVGSAKLLEITNGKGGCGRNNFCSDDPCKGETATHWYMGTFKTPNDQGPVVGCTWANNSSAHLWFKSSNFGGKVGLIEWNPPSACATDVGNISGPCNNVVLAFARHFTGDGASAEKPGYATLVFGARQFFNAGGDVTVAVSAKLKSEKRCAKVECTLNLTPTGTYSGLYTQEDGDFRVRFRVTRVLIRRVNTQHKTLGATVYGFVTDRKGGGPACITGASVTLHGFMEDGKSSRTLGASIRCGRSSHSFRKYTLNVVGSALSG